ncbi:MAG: hypothetical protein K2N81_08665 [Acetatifactor sp.]|nr:hypothetical protein [Acetatifactor sp.]
MYSGQTRPTVEYDRQIRYLDYMENGQRCRGAGFVKLERSDDRCNISLQISGLYRKDCFTRPLYLLSGHEERELCKLQLSNGGIKTYLEGLNSHDLDGQGLDYKQLTGLRIPISESKEILCLWAASETRGSRMSHSPEREPEMQAEEAAGQAGEAGQPGRQTEDAAGRSDRQIAGHAAGRTAGQVEGQMPEIETWTGERDEGTDTAPVAFREDKWEQLWAIYPHINPFSDEREYLSLGPSDFVILPGSYYKLVNNSFLLHGYYNYHHLILARVRHRNSVYYYIGVPGNLYQREKKIAIMFGFEGFECAAEPAGDGAFGYYLIPVEL